MVNPKSLKRKILIVGGGPGGRISYMMLRNMGIDDAVLVVNEEPTIICSLPYAVGRELIPEGPEKVVVDLSRPEKLPPDTMKDVLIGEVTSLDVEGHRAVVTGREGSVEVTFEKAILAPGAVPWIPPVPGVLDDSDGGVDGTWVWYGKELVPRSSLASNVYSLRGAHDARALDDFAAKAQKAVVVGSGAIGLEIVEALVHRGLTVTLLEALPHVTSALDAPLAARLEDRLVSRGVTVGKGIALAEVTSTGVTLDDGTAIEAHGVIFATGVRPNAELARQAGLSVDRGIIVDETMRTSHPDVFAVGDAAEIIDGPTGRRVLPLIGTLAMRQALVAVSRILGMPMTAAPATPWGVSETLGLHWASVGWTEEAATAMDLAVTSLALPYNTREPYMAANREGLWKLTVATAPDEKTGIRPGQILGFQALMEDKSPLFLAERFLDIVTRRETVMDLARHHFIHSPAHNDVNDPYLQLLFMARKLFMSH